jgi:hypothetical protein
MRGMVACLGCGFNVEQEDVRPIGETGGSATFEGEWCRACRRCMECPDMRESYRRGFNAGMNAIADALSKSLGEARAELRRPDGR